MFDVQEELKKLPAKPGVYIMHDERDAIIYVGKAVNLHNRVRSYFRKIVGRGPQIDQMVRQIARFEYIVTDSELEALILENNLIKEHRPKYNTMLKDDKTYPYIKVTVAEPYPRILFARRQKKDKARYFGPYTSAQAVRSTIELLNRMYGLRDCARVLPRDCGTSARSGPASTSTWSAAARRARGTSRKRSTGKGWTWRWNSYPAATIRSSGT